jgi:hypothetical protein
MEGAHLFREVENKAVIISSWLMILTIIHKLLQDMVEKNDWNPQLSTPDQCLFSRNQTILLLSAPHKGKFPHNSVQGHIPHFAFRVTTEVMNSDKS